MERYTRVRSLATVSTSLIGDTSMKLFEMLKGVEPEPEPIEERPTLSQLQQQCELQRKQAELACKRYKDLRRELALTHTTVSMIIDELDRIAKVYKEPSSPSMDFSNKQVNGVRADTLLKFKEHILSGNMLPDDILVDNPPDTDKDN